MSAQRPDEKHDLRPWLPGKRQVSLDDDTPVVVERFRVVSRLRT